MNQSQRDVIVENYGGKVPTFGDDGRLMVLVQLDIFEEDEDVLDVEGMPFEVARKTLGGLDSAGRLVGDHRESFESLDDAVEWVVQEHGGTVDALVDSFNQEITEEHLGMTMDEIKAALGQ